MSKLLHDNKRLTKKNTELEETAEAASDVMREKEKLTSQLEELVKVTFTFHSYFCKVALSIINRICIFIMFCLFRKLRIWP